MASFLIVDDEVNATAALRELLESDGHEVAAFTDPREALATLEGSTFDAVVTDLEMPHVRGEALVRFARERHPTTCIFAVSARPARGMVGACHVFEKPFHYQSVTKLVERCRTPEHRGCCREEAGSLTAERR